MSRVDELEEEVAASRERLNATIDAIQDRLTVSGMVDEVMGQTGVTGLESGRNVVQDLIRRYPVPIMIAAAGIGLLIYRAKRRAVELEGAMIPVSPVAGARSYDPDEPHGRPRLEATESRAAVEA